MKRTTWSWLNSLRKPMRTNDLARARLTVRGAVQGVGFRPYVYRLATELKLSGWVSNSAEGVFVELEGSREQVQRFILRIENEKPPHSFIQSLETSWLDPAGYSRFEIRASESRGGENCACPAGHCDLRGLSPRNL